MNLINMDFDDIKSSFTDYLKQQSTFNDYNFTGSSLQVLLNLLAYDAQQTAYLANMLANESNIDTAILRENVVSRAKVVGYIPKSRKSSKAIISVTIDDPLNEATSLLMPRGTKFLAGGSGQVFSFITLSDYNLYLNEVSGLYENSEIEIYEGTMKAASWTVVEGTRYVINNTNIDTDTLKVGVFKSYNNTDGDFYEKAIGLERIKPESKVFWVNETDGSRYELIFGDGVFGVKPENTNVVYSEFLATNGPTANGYTRFTLAGTFAGYENNQITITTIDPSNGGSLQEQTSSVKINAPRAYSAQGKATVVEDYASLVTELYPYAKSVNVWGGDEEIPVKYGKTYISVIPNGGGILTDYAKATLVRQIKRRNTSGITPVFVDAEYIKFNLNAIVNVRRNSIAQMKSFSNEIRDSILTFFNDKFYTFGSSFFYSNLVTDIENYSRSITSVKLGYELSIDGTVGKEVFDFKNSIHEGSIRSNKLKVPANASTLSIVDKSGILYIGETVVGSVDYESGYISITNSTITSSDNTIEVFVTPTNDDVIVSNRTVIAIDENRLSVEMKVV